MDVVSAKPNTRRGQIFLFHSTFTYLYVKVENLLLNVSSV